MYRLEAKQEYLNLEQKLSTLNYTITEGLLFAQVTPTLTKKKKKLKLAY